MTGSNAFAHNDRAGEILEAARRAARGQRASLPRSDVCGRSARAAAVGHALSRAPDLLQSRHRSLGCSRRHGFDVVHAERIADARRVAPGGGGPPARRARLGGIAGPIRPTSSGTALDRAETWLDFGRRIVDGRSTSSATTFDGLEARQRRSGVTAPPARRRCGSTPATWTTSAAWSMPRRSAPASSCPARTRPSSFPIEFKEVAPDYRVHHRLELRRRH